MTIYMSSNTDAIVIDLRKAFDRVAHSQLYSKKFVNLELDTTNTAIGLQNS